MRFLLTVGLLFWLALPAGAQIRVENSNTATVVNTVSVSANSGSQSVDNGEVSTGSAQAQVKVYTIINGQAVVEIEETASNEGDATVKVQSETSADSAGYQSRTTVENQGEVKTYENSGSFSTDASAPTGLTNTPDEDPAAALISDEPSESAVSAETDAGPSEDQAGTADQAEVSSGPSWWQKLLDFFNRIFSIFK